MGWSGGLMRKLAVVLVCLVGCSSNNSGGPLTIDSYQAAFVDGYCNELVECGLVDDVALCHTLYLDVNVDPDIIAAVHAGKVIFHGDLARSCLNAFFSASCDRTEFPSPRSL